jgi:hypothetical protein
MMVATALGSQVRRLAFLGGAVAGLMLGFLLLGHAGGAIADCVSAGDRTRVSPISHLGDKPDLSGCTSAPQEVGSATAVYCRDWNAIATADGTVQVVSLHGPGDASVVAAYRNALPRRLSWGDTIDEVTGKLGPPGRITGIYGTPTLVYMYRDLPYGSLELRFSDGGGLMAVNACAHR